MSVRQTIEAFWKGHSAGDHEALKKILSPEVKWHVAGNSNPIARTYEGHDGFLGELLGGLAAALRPGTLSMTLRGIYADEDKGVGVLHIDETGTLLNGNRFATEIVDVFTVRDGRIVDVREVMDMVPVNRAFGF